MEGGAKRRSVPDLAERLFVASEKQISTKVSVKEVLMSLSSKGKCFLACPSICIVDLHCHLIFVGGE